MGSSTWKPTDWDQYATKTQTKTQQQIFTQNHIHADMNPVGVTIRESRDSDNHPESNAIIIAFDETGSMGIIPEHLVKEKLGLLVQEILARKPINDPQILFMGVGDAYSDSSPLQVGQFESDITMTHWLEKIYLEGCGGGNGGESYLLPWYFAGLHTATDSFEKRSHKGYLFTIGDEHCHQSLTKEQIKRFVGDDVERDYTAEEILSLATKLYHVYHIIIKQGGGYDHSVTQTWRKLLGERALEIDDYNALAEVIVSTIQVNEGATIHDVSNSWTGNTALVVNNAIKHLSRNNAAGGVQRF